MQVLLINEKGSVSMEEMRRSDILKMTHEAANASHLNIPLHPEDSSSNNNNSKANVTRQPEVPSFKREDHRSFSAAHVSSANAPVRSMAGYGLPHVVCSGCLVLCRLCTCAICGSSTRTSLRPTNRASLCASRRSSLTLVRSPLDSAFLLSAYKIHTFVHMVVMADPLRTIIMRNACIVFIPDGADSLISILKDKFRELLAEKESEVTPFEFRCSILHHQLHSSRRHCLIERCSVYVIVICVELSRPFSLRCASTCLRSDEVLSVLALIPMTCCCRLLFADCKNTFPTIMTALERLANTRITSGELETLRSLKNTINDFGSQVQARFATLAAGFLSCVFLTRFDNLL